MPWTPLSERWASLPLVLAGPVLRRVQPDLVTVWVAVKTHQQVTLLVLDAAGDTVLTGARETAQLGPGCHLVAVTARPATAQAPRLRPGVLYHYDLAFGGALRLRSPGVVAADYTRPGEPVSALGYGSDDALPSFSLPPADPAAWTSRSACRGSADRGRQCSTVSGRCRARGRQAGGRGQPRSSTR
ncbi:MAG TPA: hypothetical protein VFC00_12900 [Micromonosporaceae bacterium]|nr:hypothetical protein [Micromonosporaceae bacterium]